MKPRTTRPENGQYGAALTLAVFWGVSAWALNGLLELMDVGESAPLPFVWRDIVEVYFVSALPLGAVLACALKGHVSDLALLVASLLCLAAGAGFLLAYRQVGTAIPDASPGFSNVLTGAVSALAGAFSVCSFSALAFGKRLFDSSTSRGFSWLAGLVGVLVLATVPTVYVDARVRNDALRLSAYMEQSRLGEALKLARALNRLDPRQTWRGQPLSTLTSSLERDLFPREERVSMPLPDNASDKQRLHRAGDLAILGRPAEALQMLDKIRQSTDSADVQLLRATIYETQGRWSLGRQCYESAVHQIEENSELPQRERKLLQAIRGVAVCERNLGNYLEAEAAYLKVLRMAPTPDNHFLLALFYADTKQVTNAQTHARLAMAEAPEQYQRDGQLMLDKLATYHFGCFTVQSAK